MTCIVGIVADGRTWIGADSCVSDSNTRQPTMIPKLWRAGGYLVGAAGNGGWFAMLQRLKWPSVASAGYVASGGFAVDLVTAAAQLGIDLPVESDHACDGAALIGGAGRLWYVDAQLCASEHHEAACGSGGEGARCVLHARRGTPRRRILAALGAVAAVRWDVAPPFTIEAI